MSGMRLLRGLAMICAAAVAACSGEPVAVQPPTARPATGTASLLRSLGPPAFRSTVWKNMPDSQMNALLAAVGGRVVVGFKRPGHARGVTATGLNAVPDGEAVAFKAQVRALGLTIEREYDLIPAVVATVPAGALTRLRALPFIDYVEPLIPGERDAAIAQQDTTWEVRHLGTYLTWPITDGAGVNILIIDSGRDPSHPDLANIQAYTCVGGSTADQSGHGTFVAGIIGATNNSTGIIGGAYGASVFSQRDGDETPSTDGVICAVEWGRAHNMFVMNISASLGYSQALTDEINAAYGEGRLIVATSGNDAGPVHFPGNLANVIAVGGTTQADGYAGYGRGPEVELVAPALGVKSTKIAGQWCGDTITGPYGYCSGTSFAAPQVTYAAALVKAHSPGLTNVEVRARLQATATDLGASGRDTLFGFGLLNVASALGNGGSTPISSAAIDGPSCLQAGGSYTYAANITGGTAPYLFEWTRSASPSGPWTSAGYGSPVSIYFPGGSYRTYLKLRSTDAVGTLFESTVIVQMNGAAFMAPDSTGNHRDMTVCGGGGGSPPPQIRR
jgi:hypothetical protein